MLPLFQGISLRGLTPVLIRGWLIWMAEKRLSGHRTGAMMENYSHSSQVLDFAAAGEKLERAIEEA